MAAKKIAKKTTELAVKKAAKKAVIKPPADVSEPKKAPARASMDMIARAAYLNYRHRVESGLPGDSHGDWLEAERQAVEQTN